MRAGSTVGAELYTPLAVFAAAVGLLASSNAGAETVATRGGHLARLGPLRVDRPVSPRDARLALGAPTRVHHPISGACELIYRRPRLVLDFGVRGLGAPRACSNAELMFARLGAGWRTDRGLRVGDRQGRVRQLYPHARRGHHHWALLLHGRPLEPSQPMGSPLFALVHRGRIRAFGAFALGAA